MENRPMYENRVERLMKSYSNEWTEAEREQVEKDLQNFNGLEFAKTYFRENAMRKFTCCICGCEFFDQTGCNPWPIADGEENSCCHDCDHRFVLPMRFRMLQEHEDDTDAAEELHFEFAEKKRPGRKADTNIPQPSPKPGKVIRTYYKK